MAHLSAALRPVLRDAADRVAGDAAVRRLAGRGLSRRLTEIVIVDANGRHVVQIARAIELRSATEQVNAEKAFLAYRQIGVPNNCMVAPFDAMVPMIFQRAYGPATHAECEAWVAQNCGKA